MLYKTLFVVGIPHALDKIFYGDGGFPFGHMIPRTNWVPRPGDASLEANKSQREAEYSEISKIRNRIGSSIMVGTHLS